MKNSIAWHRKPDGHVLGIEEDQPSTSRGGFGTPEAKTEPTRPLKNEVKNDDIEEADQLRMKPCVNSDSKEHFYLGCSRVSIPQRVAKARQFKICFVSYA